MKRINSSYFFFFLFLLIFCSCSKKSDVYIPVADESDLKVKHKDFLNELNYNTFNKKSPISSYYSRKSSLMVGASDSKWSLNVSVYLLRDSLLNGIVSLPFPPLDVANFRCLDSKLSYKLKLKSISQTIDSKIPLQSMIQSFLFGEILPLYELFGLSDYSSFDIFIQDSLFVLQKSSEKQSLTARLNTDYTLNNLTYKSSDYLFEFTCGSYSYVDSCLIPLSVDVSCTLSNSDTYTAGITLKNVMLNSGKKIEYK